MNKSIVLLFLFFLVLENSFADIVFSPVLYGKKISFSYKLKKRLQDKEYKISSVFSSCPCVKVNYEKKGYGEYLLLCKITTYGFGRGLKKRKIMIKSNDWESPVENLIINYYVVRKSEVIRINVFSNRKEKDFYSRYLFLYNVKRKYGDAVEIKFINSKKEIYTIDKKKFFNFNIFKAYLLPFLAKKYGYLDYTKNK